MIAPPTGHVESWQLNRRFDPAVLGFLRVALPCAALFAYACVVAWRALPLSSAMFLSADAPEPSQQAAGIVSGHMFLPLHTELVPTLVEGGLLHVPFGHAAIQLLGPVLAVVAVMLLCMTVRDLHASWWITAVVAGAAGPLLIWSELFPTARVYSFVAQALLAFTVVRAARGRAGRVLLASAGIVAGTALVGDQGFAATGVLPLMLAGGVLAVEGARTIATRVLLVVVVTAVVAAGAELALLAAGVHFESELFFAARGLGAVPLASGLIATFRMVGLLATGQWQAGPASPPWDALTILAGLAVTSIAPTVLALSLRRARREPADLARSAYILFWAAADLLVLAVFVLFGYSEAANQTPEHYLIPCVISAAATLPLLTPRRPWALSAVAATWAAVQAVAIALVPAAIYAGPHPPLDPHAIVAQIESTGVTIGYSDYWESYPLTWASDEALHVYPVDVRSCGSGDDVCAYAYTPSSWYRPRSGPSFLVLRSSYPCVSHAPAVLGRPYRTIVVNADTTVLFYSYDIAARFATQPVTTCAL